MVAFPNDSSSNGIPDSKLPMTLDSASGRGRGLSAFSDLLEVRLNRDGSMFVLRSDGVQAHGHLGREALPATSAIATTTYLPASSRLHLETTRGHVIIVELATPDDLAPVGGRPSIYLDQNHWSTLTNAIHWPERVSDREELSAAKRLVELVVAKAVILPMSAGHMSETCKQVEVEQRYHRAFTIAQLSAGWQLRDPLALRRFELRQILSTRYSNFCQLEPAAVTLEPNALFASRGAGGAEIESDLPSEVQWILEALRCTAGIMDTMLDAEHVPMNPVPGWAPQFERFAEFLAENPTGREMKRRRTHAKFIADLGRELPEEAHRAGISPEQMGDWVIRHSESDLRDLPVLGLYREILHEKLCDPHLRWEPNDLIDMMYLTSGSAHCDYVVAERSHASHLVSCLRRLGRPPNVHRRLREVVDLLPPAL